VLNAVVFLVVISLLVELPHDVKYYWKMRSYNDLALMALTFVLTIAYNIEVGVLVSFVISLLVVVRRSSKVRISILGRVAGTNKWSPISEDPEAEELPSWTGVLVIAIRESLDFANTAQLKERLRRLELFGHEPHHPSERPRRKKAKTLGFDMGDVESIDAAAVEIFLELLESYKARNVNLFLTRVHLHDSVATSLSRSGIIDKVIGLGRVFDSLEEADRVMDLSVMAGGPGTPGTAGAVGATGSSAGGGAGGGGGVGNVVSGTGLGGHAFPLWGRDNANNALLSSHMQSSPWGAATGAGGGQEPRRRGARGWDHGWDAPSAWLSNIQEPEESAGGGSGRPAEALSPSSQAYYTGEEGESETPTGQRSRRSSDSVDPKDAPVHFYHP